MRQHRNNTFSSPIPSVGWGEEIQARHLNDIGRAIEQNTLRSVIGGGISRTTRGTSIVPFRRPSTSFPFEVTVNGKGIFVRRGYVFSDQDVQTSIYRAHGTPISCSATNSEYVDEEPWGYWYWPHPDLTNTYRISIRVGGGAAELRYTNTAEVTIENSSPYGVMAREFPIAIIEPYNNGASFSVEQIVSEDIYAYWDNHPFKITSFTLPTYGEDANGNTIAGPPEVRVKLSFGTINGIVPKYQYGGECGDMLNSMSIGTGAPLSKMVYMRVKLEPKPSDYPIEAEIRIGDSMPANDSQYAYLGIGLVYVQNIGNNMVLVGIQQAARNNIWASAHRYVPNKVDYYFGAV